MRRNDLGISRENVWGKSPLSSGLNRQPYSAGGVVKNTSSEEF